MRNATTRAVLLGGPSVARSAVNRPVFCLTWLANRASAPVYVFGAIASARSKTRSFQRLLQRVVDACVGSLMYGVGCDERGEEVESKRCAHIGVWQSRRPARDASLAFEEQGWIQLVLDPHDKQVRVSAKARAASCDLPRRRLPGPLRARANRGPS